MFLTVHTVVGAVIGQTQPNPALAFGLGFISHFILDVIPHGDDELITKKDGTVNIKKFIAIAVIDSLATLGLVVYLYFTLPPELTAGMLWGAAGAILPDILNITAIASRLKIFKRFCVFHAVMHNLIKQKRVAYPYLILLQLIIFTFFWSLLPV